MKKKFKYLIIFAAVIIGIILLTRSTVVKEVLYLVFSSFLIAYTLKPLQVKLINKGVNRRFTAILLIIFCIIFVFSAFGVIIPSIVKESSSVKIAANELRGYLDKIYDKIKPFKDNKTMHTILKTLYSKFDNAAIQLFNKAFNMAISIGEDAFFLAVLPIISYYFLADGDKLYNKFLVIFPAKMRGIVKKIVDDIDKILARYIAGQFMLCLIIGILTFIILVMLHVNFPVILSLLNAVFNIIPYFGPLFGAIPAVIIALLKSPQTAIYTAIWLNIIQQIEGNIISPKITGESVSMHPLLVILLLIVGGKLGGFIGMVIAVPIGVVIKVIYEDLNYYFF